MDADVRMAGGRPSFLNTLAAVAAVTITLAAGSATAGTATPGSGGPLNIGVIFPFSGDNAHQGTQALAGCLSGVAPINAGGGVLGARLACKQFDTKGDPADAVPAASLMMSSDNLVMAIGAGDEAVATAPIVTSQYVTNFTSIGDPHFDHQSNPYFWHVSPSDALQGIALGYSAATHGMTHAAAVFTSDIGAQTNVPPLRTEYAKLGGKLAADVTLTPGQSSYRNEVPQVIQSHPDALISEMDPQSSAAFLSQYQQLNGGQLPIFLGTQLTSSSDWITSVLAGVGPASFQKYIKSIVPYVSLGGPGYDLFKTSLLGLGSPVMNPGRFVGNPYAIGDFASVA